MATPSRELAETPKRKKVWKYGPEDETRFLTELALCAGNTRLAAKNLKERGHPVSRDTLQGWKRTHRERYEEIRRELVPVIHAKIASEAEDVIRRSHHAELKLLDQLDDAIEKGDLSARDTAQALRNVSTTKGITMTHLPPLRDKPSQIVEHRHGEDVLRALASKVGVRHFDAEAQAEEIEEAT